MMFILYHVLDTVNLHSRLIMCILYLTTIYIIQTNPNRNIISNFKLIFW